ncbi:MAG: insulinase family protein [Armatimonadetes bacterium]|nr:insulinase family protein [Armatimonadota bacterium]
MGRARRPAAAAVIVVGLALLAAPLNAQAPPAVHRAVLPNGLVVLARQMPGVNLVAVEVLVRGGQRYETPKTTGLATFVAEMLLKGAGARTAQDIALGMEAVGGELTATAAPDYIEVTAVVTPAHAGLALEMVADILQRATVDPAEVERQRRLILARIRAQGDRPLDLVWQRLLRALYPHHPYGSPLAGTPEAVASFTRQDLLDYYRTFFVPNNMVVSVAGALRADEAVARVSRALGEMRPARLPARVGLLPSVERALAPRPTALRELREPRQTRAAWLAIGFLAPGAHSADYPPLKVLNAVMGEMQSSRLYAEIRQKQGLAYQVGSVMPTRAGPGYLLAYAGTTPEQAARVRDDMLKVVAGLRAGPVPADEVERAKGYLIGNHAIGHERIQRQAWYPAWYEALGLGFAYDARYPELIARVTSEDVQRVARKYLDVPTVVILAPGAP